MPFTPNDDVNILQASDPGIIDARGGNDTYIVSPLFPLKDDQSIIINDTQGDNNTLHLTGGLFIASSQVANDGLLLILSNGAQITLTLASNFSFDLGGEIGDPAEKGKTFTEFVEETLGVTVPEPGAPPVVIEDPIVIGEDPPVENTYTLAKALALGEDLPAEYNIEDSPENLFDNGAFATDAEAILDGAAAIEVTDFISVAQYDLVDGLATFDIANLTYSISDTWNSLWPQIGAPILEDVVYEITDPEGTDFGLISEEELAFIEGAVNYEPGFWAYEVLGEIFTVAEAVDAAVLGELPENYQIEDEIGPLETVNLAEMKLIEDAQLVNVLGTATVAQIDTFNTNYDNLS